ncbi:hypothetical protein V6N12_023256 [Hibiscus sabdariffa]|uniref:Uncharacterized protein n=1 Tax=Hibiscus sabdariffa TaxID=183260 RepID=A0ABR2FX49_9ROSI
MVELLCNRSAIGWDYARSMLTEGWKIEEENHWTVLTLASEAYREAAASGGFEMLNRCTSLLIRVHVHINLTQLRFMFISIYSQVSPLRCVVGL